MAVAIDQQHHGFKPFSRSQRCKLQSFTNLDFQNIIEIGQTNLAHSIKKAFEVVNIHRSFSTPCLSVATNNVEDDSGNKPRIEILGGQHAARTRALVVEVAIAMASGVEPTPVSSGLGGAYFVRNRNGDILAVAKPVDEEPLALNNPKGFGGLMLGQPGLKRSIRVGETGIRELAAYLLDHGGFAGVPPTALVKISHTAFHVKDHASALTIPCKVASLQRYIDHEFDAGELGPSGFSVSSVHRIGIFDIRILNLDRHAGNILVRKHNQQENYSAGAAELVPIDHGLCLPEWLDDPYFEWLHWPQASVPFSELEIEYISNLDPFKDAELLRNELPNLRESSIRVLVLCTIFLKRAADAGLCLADIGKMFSRESCGAEENCSLLEDLCTKAKASMPNHDYEDEFYNDESKGEIENENEKDEDFQMFQFDDENEDSSMKDVPKLPKTPMQSSKPPKVPRILSSAKSMPGLKDKTLTPLYEETETDNENSNNSKSTTDNDPGRKSGNNNDDVNKVIGGGLIRSVSYSTRNCACDSEGESFKDMSEDEWSLFLECFEKLLPEVFEDSKSIGLKQRLGTSCKF
ncbi:hypothetical protein ACFE04_013417 [Oxalis oulophora]